MDQSDSDVDDIKTPLEKNNIPSSLVLYDTRAPIIGTFSAWKPPIPYAIKNQRGASKIPLVGGIFRSKAPSRGLWMPELVLYGIRLLAKQFHGTFLDIEVDQSALRSTSSIIWTII